MVHGASQSKPDPNWDLADSRARRKRNRKQAGVRRWYKRQRTRAQRRQLAASPELAWY